MKYKIENISKCTLVPEGNVFFIKVRYYRKSDEENLFFVISEQEDVQEILIDCIEHSYWEPGLARYIVKGDIVNIYGHFTTVCKTIQLFKKHEYGPEPLSYLCRVFDNDLLMKVFNGILLNTMVLRDKPDEHSCFYVINKNDKSIHIKSRKQVTPDEVIFMPDIELPTFINLITDKYDDGSYVDFMDGIIDEDPSLDWEYIYGSNIKADCRQLISIANECFWYRFEKNKGDKREYVRRMNEIKKDIAEVFLKQSGIF